jgi:hypothetical protein
MMRVTRLKRGYRPNRAAGRGGILGIIRMQCTNGAQGRNRTTDTVIFSHVLYQLSYLGAGASSWEAAAPAGAGGLGRGEGL